ncbi:MAG TPA: cation:proton antiporter [Gaiellaceae bacterium]|jgi:potassium/hydrogen antiporter|nr:cation:proton antiporter [Gaiellaceae bacterium]
MDEIANFGLDVLVVSAGLLLAVLGTRLAARVSLPNAAIFLAVTAVLASTIEQLDDVLTILEVERIVVVALVVILFDGGLHIGLARFRRSVGPILALGVLGTFATAGLVTLAAHYLLGLPWIVSGLVGAAIAPTDPAVTFSVLGGREVRGRAGTVLEGEAGTNDPVGIALMIGLIELANEDDGSFSIVVSEFALEMAIGLAVGVAGAMLLLPLLRQVHLPSPTLYPLRVLAGAGIVYGIASVAHGSGFLAVFVAGVLLGDVAIPRKGEIETFHSSLAALAEIAAFAVLGLSVGFTGLDDAGIWGQGLALALVLAFVARPLAVWPLLLPTSLTRGEKLFVVWGGLKGAVPILLGALAVLREVDDSERIYGIVFVVVLFSVIVQGASVPHVATRLGLSFRAVDHDLAEVLEYVVREDAFANGRSVRDLPLGDRAWVGVLVRDGRPRAFGPDTTLRPGDRVHVYCQPEDAAALARIFAAAI